MRTMNKEIIMDTVWKQVEFDKRTYAMEQENNR